MNLKRKKIAVITTEIESVYQTEIIKGINEEAAFLGCEILVFTTFMRTTYLPEYRIGEINIYNLINYDDLDGIILLYLPLEQDELLEEILPDVMSKAKCPIVCIDNGKPDRYSFDADIYAEDKSCMEVITDHVIDVHGCKKIYCITGPEKDRGADARLSGYFASMEKHGLNTDGCVFRGAFWYDNGEKVAQDIISGKLERPEAIVCVGDHIAAGAANLLNKNGIKVPDDIIVTGYDASDIAISNELLLTSILPPVKKEGASALARLWSIITGTETENVLENVTGTVICGESCGCECSEYYTDHKNVRDYVANHNYSTRPRTDMSILDKSFMPEKLTASSGQSDCFQRICEFTYLINDYRFFILMMCDGWDDVSSDKDYLTSGYSPKVKLVIHSTSYDYLIKHPELIGDKGWCIYDDYEFATVDIKQLAPDLHGKYDEPLVWYFTPLHFEDRCLGYAVLACAYDQPPFDHIYRNWMRNVTNALEMQRIRNILMQHSTRDSLTGLYNRRGLDKFIGDNTPREKGSKLFYLVADMDRLKYINDTFGHAEGDNGIKIVSSAAVACTGYNEICARTGGDEFAVVGFGKYTDEDIERHTRLFNSFIDKYNESSGKPYKVSASIGICCCEFDPGTNVSYAAELADKIMYEHKTAARKNRRD